MKSMRYPHKKKYFIYGIVLFLIGIFEALTHAGVFVVQLVTGGLIDEGSGFPIDYLLVMILLMLVIFSFYFYYKKVPSKDIESFFNIVVNIFFLAYLIIIGWIVLIMLMGGIGPL